MITTEDSQVGLNVIQSTTACVPCSLFRVFYLLVLSKYEIFIAKVAGCFDFISKQRGSIF